MQVLLPGTVFPLEATAGGAAVRKPTARPPLSSTRADPPALVGSDTRSPSKLSVFVEVEAGADNTALF